MLEQIGLQIGAIQFIVPLKIIDTINEKSINSKVLIFIVVWLMKNLSSDYQVNMYNKSVIH